MTKNELKLKLTSRNYTDRVEVVKQGQFLDILVKFV